MATMLLGGCPMIPASFYSNKKTKRTKTYLASSRTFCQPSSNRFSFGKSSQKKKLLSVKGNLSMNLSPPLTPLLSSNRGSLLRSIQMPPTRRRPLAPARAAYDDVPRSSRYPAMTKKPEWWWRVLACLPYIMPLLSTLPYEETAYVLLPYLENLDFLTHPLHVASSKLPSWSPQLFSLVAYLGIVRRKEWPHFLRYHTIISLLLDTSLGVMAYAIRFFPLAWCWDKFGKHIWVAMAFAYLLTVLESVRCALFGMYADIPYVNEAAYMQIPYE